MLPQPLANDSFAEIKTLVREGFQEFSKRFDRVEERLATLEKSTGTFQQVWTLQMGLIQDQVKELKTSFRDHNDGQFRDQQKLEDRIEALEPWVRAMRWVVIVLGSSILALVWAILTHQVELIFH